MGLRNTAIMAAILLTLGSYFVFTNNTEPDSDNAPRPELWSVHMDDLVSLTITLPVAGKGMTWIKRPDGNWHFDIPDGGLVDVKRWGAGIPLMLSKPKAERLIVSAASQQQLESYGLQRPRMTLNLTLNNGRTFGVEVGDPTPGESTYYVRLTGQVDVYAVHHTWFEVLEQLILDPPHVTNGG